MYLGHIRTIVVVASVAAVPLWAHAAMLTHVRDTITTSEPSIPASHVIEFTTLTAVPPSGHIVITPQAGAFSIPTDLSYVDADLAIATSSGLVEQDIAASASALAHGLSVTPGMNGSLDFTLNSTDGIPAGARIRIVAGLAASFGDVSTTSITNPAAIGSYRIAAETRNQVGSKIDGWNTMIAIVRPVTQTVSPTAFAPIRSSGSPSGTVAGNSTTVEISLKTADPATCRYGTVASTTYASLPSSFLGWDSNRTFTANISTQNATTYTFYVRCIDLRNHLMNTDDYVITFSVGPDPESNTSVAGSGSASSGGGGSGPFPNGSSVLFLSTVTLNGWAAPNSSIQVLKDGIKAATIQSRSSGAFSTQVNGLERGVYTFAASAKDGSGRSSGSVSTTLTLEQGTNNTISDIVVPPTLASIPVEPAVGDPLQLVGASVPNARVEVSMLLKSKDPVAPSIYAASTSPAGEWHVEVPASAVSKGSYIVKARVIVSDTRKSDWGTTLILGIGEASNTAWGRSDLNHDGKVNLVDFSILLTTWTADGIGDINKDGTTNLADFSIMLFDWTG